MKEPAEVMQSAEVPVGVHIRRGDFLKGRRYGRRVVDASYLRNAVQEMATRLRPLVPRFFVSGEWIIPWRAYNAYNK